MTVNGFVSYTLVVMSVTHPCVPSNTDSSTDSDTSDSFVNVIYK